MTIVASHEPLFQPLRVGPLSIKNRIVMAPMTRCFSPGGVPGSDVAAYYKRRAEGGVGLIITEGTWIPHHAASNDENVPRFYGMDALTGWRAVADAVHGAGGLIVPQLWHVGLVRKPEIENLYREGTAYDRFVSPSGFIMPGERLGSPMSEVEAEEVIAAYAAAAGDAQALGFDGVEIHGAHGYLVDQFFWTATNQRTDRFGGARPDRTRFAAEVIRACRQRVGEGFPILFRFSQWKQQDYSARLAETPQELAELLEPLTDAGVNLFHCSQRRFWEAEFPGSRLNLAGWTKKLTGRHTITVGSVGLDQEFLTGMFAESQTRTARLDNLIEMLERGDFDLVAVGRALLVDPYWAQKIRNGLWDDLLAYSRDALASLS